MDASTSNLIRIDVLQLMRGRESALWELEERQIHEKQQLAKRQLKDIFFLQRHQVFVKYVLKYGILFKSYILLDSIEFS